MAKSKSSNSRHRTKYRDGGSIGAFEPSDGKLVSHEAGPSNSVPSPGRGQPDAPSKKFNTDPKRGGTVTGG